MLGRVCGNRDRAVRREAGDGDLLTKDSAITRKSPVTLATGLDTWDTDSQSEVSVFTRDSVSSNQSAEIWQGVSRQVS